RGEKNLEEKKMVVVRRAVTESDRPAESASKPLLLDSPLAPLVPPDKRRAFQLTGLKTVEDLLYFAPKWALHRSNITPIGKCEGEGPFFIKARVNGISQTRRGPREMIKVNLDDGSGYLSWIWFNRPFLKKEMVNGRWVVLHETPQVSKWGRQVTGKAETYEFLEEREAGLLDAEGMVVLYPSTPTLTQDFWKKLIG